MMPPGDEGTLNRKIERLDRETRNQAADMSITEARYFVDAYYQQQEYRKAVENQIRAATEAGEMTGPLKWYGERTAEMESRIKSILAAWVKGRDLGRWCDSVTGIGPVIGAGLMAHIDITKTPTAGGIWRFAGLDHTQRWLGTEKAKKAVSEYAAKHGDLNLVIPMLAEYIGTRPETLRRLATSDNKGKPIKLTKESLSKAAARRPWNATLKTLCWKIGESFVKVAARENDLYGGLYLKRKAQEIEANERGDFAGQAKSKLETTKIGKTTEAYLWYAGCLTPELAAGLREMPAEKRGAALKQVAGKPGSGVPMLPPAHIHARAKRWAVKLFLAHYHHMAYRIEYGCEPPKPYVIEHLGHVHEIKP